jgi:DNA-binding transcriptional regulator YiaG
MNPANTYVTVMIRSKRRQKNQPSDGKTPDWRAYLRGFRSRHGLTQAQLALLLNDIPVRTVEGWEQAEFTPPPYLKRALRDIACELSGKAVISTSSSP